MKQKLTLWLACLAFLFTGSLSAQTYGWWDSGASAGNPGGVRTIADYSNSTSYGYTNIHAYNAGLGSSSNEWSAAQTIPFSFNFNGSAVTKFCVSKNGLVTFDTTVASTVVDTNLNDNSSLPNSALPNNTIAYWDAFNPALGSNDNVWTGTEGTSPNRQHWIVYHSYKIGTLSYSYFAVVLEESTNNIYLVDMNYVGSGTASFTKGLQVNSTTAFEVTGSPNLSAQYIGSTAPDNTFITFAWGTCFPTGGLNATDIADVSFKANWTSNNTPIGAQVRYRTSGSTGAYTVANVSGSGATITGLTASTDYDWSVREVCAAGDTTVWSSDVTTTTAACGLTSQCQYTVYMEDSWGDGWNGNVIDFIQGGTSAGTVTLASGSSGTATVSLCSGDSVTVGVANLGSYTYEVGFTVVDPNGDTVLVRNYGSSSTASFTATTIFGTFLASCSCAPQYQCSYTVNMTDSYGDGWNGNIISFLQNGQVAGSVGSTFTNGSAATEYISLCPDDTVTVVVGTLGSWTSEVGFTVVNPNGIVVFTHTAGNTFTASTVFGQFSSPCLTPSCPVTDTLSIPAQSSCGAAGVTFTASAANPNNTVLWLDANSAVIAMGNSFTTPPVTAAVNYGATVYADDNSAGPVHFGPPTTLTGGFGNYTNGMWFSVQKPMTLDSISVISNGLVNFQVRISEGGGNKTSGHSGAELMRSDTISVAVADTHQVYVGLALMPGTYYINMAFLGGTTGQLHRATAGGAYPYTLAGVASLDSVQFGSTNVRVYYAYDWVVSEGCVGPIATASATPGAAPAATVIPYSVDFNSGIPCDWTSDASDPMWEGVTSYGSSSSSINGSAFVMIDDDAAGSSAGAVNASLTTPVIPAMGYDTITVEFDHYWRSYPGTAGYVEVYDGSNWVTVDTMTATRGSWTAPAHENYNVTMYQNNDFQVRLRYSDGTGTWGWYWAVDNFEIDGALTPCTEVRVELTTDIYGSENTWYIQDVNTGVVWASGGPYANVSPYNAAAATHIDTVCLPDNGTYEFRIVDSYGDGLDDGTNAGWYQVDILCPWGDNNVITIDTTLTSVNGAPWGAFHYGSTTNPPMYDSTVFNISCVQYTNVTFQVDMNKVTQGFTTPEVNGTWNNWCGNCNAMSDPDGDNVWEVTLPLEQGTTVEFKYSADSWTIQEMNDPTASCTNGNATYTNRVLTIPAADTVLPVVCWSSCDACSIEVTFNVNMAWEVANNAIDSNGVHVAGSFQGWSPSTTEMTDPDGDGIYSVTVEMPLNQDLFYKFINGNDWAMAEASGDLAACGVSDGFGGYNRASSVGNADTIFDPVCFTKCYDCAVSIDEALGTISLYPNPTTGAFTLERTELAGDIEVTVIGLQGQLLRATEWTAGQSELNIDLSDLAAGVYMVRLTAEEGTRTLRVAVQR